jgi:hypothetical protein
MRSWNWRGEAAHRSLRRNNASLIANNPAIIPHEA